MHLSTLRHLAGGHHVARVGAEGCVGGIAFFGWRLPRDGFFMARKSVAMYTDDMMLSLYVVLGIFLLIAAQNPSANRSLIAFTAWSSFPPATVMAVTSFQKVDERGNLWGVAALVVIGVIVLVPASESFVQASAVAA
jgi:hypothetical protein